MNREIAELHYREVKRALPRLGDFLSWLLILKPGQGMEFVPADHGVKAETVQQYAEAIKQLSPWRFKVSGGVTKDADGRRNVRDPSLPIFISRLRDSE